MNHYNGWIRQRRYRSISGREIVNDRLWSQWYLLLADGLNSHNFLAFGLKFEVWRYNKNKSSRIVLFCFLSHIVLHAGAEMKFTSAENSSFHSIMLVILKFEKEFVFLIRKFCQDTDFCFFQRNKKL